MLGIAMHITIETLWKKGKNKTQIASVTGHDWKTVDKTIRALEQGHYPEKKPHPRQLDSHKEQILKYLESDLSGKRIFEELSKSGIKTSYSTLKDFIATIKKRENVCIRFHTEPGKEVQVDFGYVGLTRDNSGHKRKTWVFNMRLSYSRMDYYQKVYDQKVETFIQCHENAFKYFGGVPEYVMVDNLKAAILEANFYEVAYQELYKKFAEHYSFKILPCRVRQPQEKGKVESGIKYIKRNFFAGRVFANSEDLDRQLRNWLDKTCNARVHGTTRKIPLEVFKEQEADKLLTIPANAFTIPDIGQRKVYHDCHVYFQYNYYSVPFEFVGKNVDIEASENIIRVFSDGRQIAVHARNKGRGEFITDNSHYPPYKCHLSTEYQEHYQLKMREIGANAEQMFFYIVKLHPREWNRTVSGILSLKKDYPPSVIDLSCKRALCYGVNNFSSIRNICKTGAYNQPSEFNAEVFYAGN